MMTLYQDDNSIMDAQEIYPSAPIKEAVIDFRVQLVDDFDLNKLEALEEAFRALFPHKEELVVQTDESGSGAVLNDTTPVVLRRLFSTDRKRAVVYNEGGFTFSILEPYDRWETFRDAVADAWRCFCEVIQPQKVTRVGLRYINVMSPSLKC